MESPFEMFCSTLRSIFMIDSAEELDFGIYRIMRIKKQEIDNWLSSRLQKVVEEQIASNMSSDYEEKKKSYEDNLANFIRMGMSEKEVLEKIPQMKAMHDGLIAIGDPADMQAQVFTHLNTFFSRYYDHGDFISQRRYKKDVYAIPYSGEEVKLYWANSDQYYIKTGKYFKNYRFALNNGKKVEFTLKEAEDPQNNQKSKRELERHFVLYDEKPFEVTDDGELHINFVYQLMSKKPYQATLRQKAHDALLEQIPDEFAELRHEVNTQTHTTLLMKHLTKYTEENRQDYFIHKDLKSFLSRELDFYIKNEMFFIDDIDQHTAKDFLKHIAVIKATKSVGQNLIQLMAQLEDYQKSLWLKKKMVAQADYLITLDKIPEAFYEEIGRNNKQREEWVELYNIDKIQPKEGEIPGIREHYSIPLSPKFLKENQTLPLDTANFDDDFRHRLIASLSDIDSKTDGLIVNSENFQALSLLSEKYRGRVKSVYIDPPYNTGNDDFVYKDNYQESSWLSCLYDRLEMTKPFFAEGGSIAVSIDIKELDKLIELLDMTFGIDNRKANITVRRASLTGAKVINPGLVNISENVVMYSNGIGKWNPQDAYRQTNFDFKKTRYKSFIINREKNYKEWELTTVLDAFSKYKGIDKRKLKRVLGDSYNDELYKFMIDNADSICRLAALDEDSVGSEVLELKEESVKNPNIIFYLPREDSNDYYILKGQAILFFKDRLKMIGGKLVVVEPVSDIWDDVLPNDIHNEGGVVLKKGKKPEKLVDRIFESTTKKGDWVMDYFAGSATSGAVALKSGRKFINVEVNEYFDSITLRRIKNTLYGDKSGVSDKYQWKGGGIVKYIRLEQYEDALNNIEFNNEQKEQNLKFDESYMLGYMLGVESRESILNLTRFAHPFTPKMLISHGTVRKEQHVDLPETFNYLLGLEVAEYQWPEDGMEVIIGQDGNGNKALVIWRDIDKVDNEVLVKYTISRNDIESFRHIYVNCDNNLAAVLPQSMSGRVLLTETEFLKRMFNTKNI